MGKSTLMQPANTTTSDAVAYYADTASNFAASYDVDPNRRERQHIWRDALDRWAVHARFAYDLGCGAGWLSCILAQKGIEVMGVDGAESMLALARQAILKQGLTNVQFRQCLLPMKDMSEWRPGDLVVASSSLEYAPSLPEALACVRSLLKSNGVAILSFSNHDSIRQKLARFIYRLIRKPEHIGFIKHFMTSHTLHPYLKAARLELVENVYLEGSDLLNRHLNWFLPPRLTRNMLLVVARARD